MLASPSPTGRLSRWLFDAVHRQNLVYNQCWEDPAVDHEALRLRPDDRVLVITSAGCNALDYALSGASVLAVDVNPRQNHLLELKRAGIRALDFEAFFDLFGHGGSGRAREIYAALRRGPARGRRASTGTGRSASSSPTGRGAAASTTAGRPASSPWPCKAWIRHGARLWSAVERLLGASHARGAARDLPPRGARTACSARGSSGWSAARR